MRYLLYKTINESEFFRIKQRLEAIERLASPIMQKHNFHLNTRSYEEVLALDYINEDHIFMGNIGVSYEEEKSNFENPLFKFYILKAHDVDHNRLFKKIELEELYSLQALEKQAVSLLEKCCTIYAGLEKKDLTDVIVLK